MGLAQNEAPRVERRVRKRGGVIMSIITTVDGVAAKMTMPAVAIGRDASLIISCVRSRAWSCNNEGGWSFVTTQTEREGGGAEECVS